MKTRKRLFKVGKITSIKKIKKKKKKIRREGTVCGRWEFLKKRTFRAGEGFPLLAIKE